MVKSFTTQALAEALDGQLIGDGALAVTRLAHPADVQGAGDLALAMDAKLLPLLEKTRAKAAVVSNKAELKSGQMQACIVVSRPRLAMAQLTNLFAEAVPVVEGIHPTAVIEPGARLGTGVSVGALAYIGAGAVIGDGSVLHPQCYIGPGAVIGHHALIHAGVRIGSSVALGERCIIHFNASIGADGFSFVTPEPGSVEQVKAGSDKVTATNQHIVRIASLGGVLIGDDVEIGANSCIDQGTIRPTRVGNGTKIDNHVQIGHNVSIGDNCLICGRVGIAGSATIGNRVVLGGAVGVADHVTVGDDAVAMAMTGIAGNIEAGSVVGGIPARSREKVMENYVLINRLKHFYNKIEALAERFDRFEHNRKD